MGNTRRESGQGQSLRSGAAQDDEATLLRAVRAALVARRSERQTAKRLLGDATIDDKWVRDILDIEDRWEDTLQSLKREGLLTRFLASLVDELKPNVPPAVHALLRSEERRQEADRAERDRAQSVMVFTEIREGALELRRDSRNLRKPEHPDSTQAAAIGKRLSRLLDRVDKLQDVGNGGFIDERDQAHVLEARLVASLDALHLYSSLLAEYRLATEEDVTTEGVQLGNLSARASDEAVLLRAKNKLRVTLQSVVDVSSRH